MYEIDSFHLDLSEAQYNMRIPLWMDWHKKIFNNYVVPLDFDKDGEADWMEVVKHFKSIKAVWGGDWKFVDKPHFEKTFGHTWKTLKAKYDNKDYFTEIIDGKEYKYINL